MDAALGLGAGHPLHPVDAALEAEEGKGPFALHFGHHFLEAALFGLALAQHGHLETPALGKAHIHAEDLRREERRLLAPRACPHFQDHVPGVLGVLGHQEVAQVGFACLNGLLQLGNLQLGQLPQLGVQGAVGEHLLGLLQLAEAAALGVPGVHHGLELAAQLAQLPQPLHVADDGRVLELGFDFLELAVEGFEMIEHGAPCIQKKNGPRIGPFHGTA